MALHCVRDSDNLPKKCIRKINANVELSTWTFEDAMAFVGEEMAIAA
jgi:hypothetical protein